MCDHGNVERTAFERTLARTFEASYEKLGAARNRNFSRLRANFLCGVIRRCDSGLRQRARQLGKLRARHVDGGIGAAVATVRKKPAGLAAQRARLVARSATYAVVRGSAGSTTFSGWSSNCTIAMGAESPARKPVLRMRK